MASKFESLIRKYCEANHITIPVGFGRNTPSRYAVILQEEPPRLVASTWFKLADVAYFLEGLALPTDESQAKTTTQILDFKDLAVLVYQGKSRFTKLSSFSVSE